MSRSIDQRIVEMQFDNAQFERGISQSMGSLKTLDKAINNLGSAGSAFSGFNNIFGKQLDFSGVSDAISRSMNGVSSALLVSMSNVTDTVGAKFSAMEVAIIQIIANITNQLYFFVNNTITTLTNKIIQGGINRAMNIENAHFMLQGLIDDENEVQAIMDDAKDSVDGTAYSYDSAAKAASQFAATGMRAGEQMQTALKGISGIAATTNSQYEDISRIFTTVAGNGRLMGDQLLQLSSRGLNVAASLSKYFKGVSDGSIQASDEVTKNVKTLVKKFGSSEAAIRDMVSKGKINFNIFSEAMGTTFGEHAKKANETFNGALSNIGAALARTGAMFVSPMIKQNGELVQLFNVIREKINEINKFIDPIATKVTDKAKQVILELKKRVEDLNVEKTFERLSKSFDVIKTTFEGVQNIFEGVSSVIKPMITAFKDLWHSWGFGIDNVQNLAEKFVKLTEKMKLTYAQQSRLIVETKHYLRTIKQLLDFLKNKLDELHPVFENVWRGIKLGVTVISQIIREIWDWIVSIKDVNITFGKSASVVKEWLDRMEEAVKRGDLISNTFTKIRNTIGPTVSKIGSALIEAGSKIKEFVVTAYTAIKDKLSNSNLFDDFKKALSSVGQSLGDFFQNKVIPNIPKFGEYFFEFLHQVALGLDSLIKGAGYKDFKAFLESGVIITFIYQLSQMLDIVRHGILNAKNLDSGSGFGRIFALFDRWTTAGSAFKKASIEVKNAMIQLEANLKANTITKVAVSIGVLAASMWLLAQVDANKLGASFGVIIVLIGELAFAMKKLNEVTQESKNATFNFKDGLKFDSKTNNVAATLLGMATALGILSLAIGHLAKLDIKSVWSSLVVLSAVLWEMFGMFVAMKKMKLGAVAEMAAEAFMRLSLALGVIAIALRIVATLEPHQLVMGLVGIAAAVLLLCVPLKSFYELSKDADLKPGIKAMKSMAVALAMMAGVVWLFGSMDILKLAQGLAGLTLVVAGMIYALKQLDGMDGKVGVGAMLVMAASLVIIASAIKKVGSLSLGDLAKGLIGLGIALAALIFAVKQLDQFNGLAGAGAILALSVAMVFLAQAIKAVGSLSVGTIVKGIVGLGIALAGIVAAALVLGEVAGPVALFGAALIVVGIGISAIGAGLVMIGAGVTMIATGFVAAIAAIVASADLIVEGIKTIIHAIAMAIVESVDSITYAITAVINAICKAVMANIPTMAETFLKIVDELLTQLLKYGPSIVNKLIDFLITIINLLGQKAPEIVEALMNFVKGVWEGLKMAIKAVDPAEILKGAGIITAFTVILVALGSIPGMKVAALNGIAVMALIVAGMIAIFVEIGIFSSLPGINWLVNKGGDLLEEIGVAIGRFFGGIVGGIGRGVSSQFPAICENVQKGLEALHIDKDTVEGIKNLAEAMLMITADTFLSSLTRFITGKDSMKEFGNKIQSFGRSFSLFYEEIKGIDDVDKVKNVCDAIKMLAEAASSIPDSGESLKSFFFGDHDISEFGRKLVSFAPHFAQFCDIIDDVDTKGVEPVANALKTLCEAANKIPDRGESLKSFFLGDHDISEFGRKLVSFGPHFADFAKSVAGIDVSGVSPTAEAIKSIAEATKNLDKEGGWMQKLLGNGNLTHFGNQLAAFGPKFSVFVKATGGLGVEQMRTSVECIKSMVDVAASLNEIYNWLDEYKSTMARGNESSPLVIFGKQLAMFAPHMAKFAKIIGEIKATNMRSIADVIKVLADVVVELSSVIINGYGMDLTSLGLQLEDIGNSLTSFASIISQIDENQVTKAVETLRTLVRIARDVESINSNKFDEFVTKMAAMGTNGIAGIIEALNESKVSVPDAIEEAVDEYITKIEEQIDRVNTIITTNVRNGLPQWTFKNIAKDNILGGLLLGLKDSGQLNSIRVASTKAGEAANNGVKAKASKNSGRNIGVDFINGLIIGLNSTGSRSALGKAASAAGNVILTYIRNRLDSHSPSREAMKIGRDVDNGLAIGMDKFSSVVEQSAKNVGEDTLNSMRESINGINDRLLNDDFRPVITPILDLSEVRSGAADVSSMFGGQQFKMAADINGMMNSYADAQRLAKSLTLDDGRMVEAITALRQDVNAMGMQMNNLKVVMDSGALVGQIARPMDAALGGRMIRREREA